jgi:hypothetical protein
MWDMANEDFEHRARRISLYQSQHMNHEAISQLFESEEQAKLEKQHEEERQHREEQRQIAETEQQEAIKSKKFEVMQKIEETVSELGKTVDSDILANYLKQEVFDKLAQQTNECQILIIATLKDGNCNLKIQLNPDIVPFDKICEIKIITKEGA